MAAFLTLPESLRLMWWMPPAWYRGGMVIPPSLAVPRWLGVFTCRLQQPFLFFAGYIIFRQTIMRTYNYIYIYISIFSYMIYIYIYTHTQVSRNLRSFWWHCDTSRHPQSCSRQPWPTRRRRSEHWKSAACPWPRLEAADLEITGMFIIKSYTYPLVN